MPVDKFGRMSDTKTKDTGVSLTYINNNYVRSDGGTPLSGSLDMGFNKLVNLHKPTEQYNAATKDYVDYIEKEIKEKLEKEIKEKLEKRTHLIVVHARYCGPLKEGEYPFKFGGNSLEICEKEIERTDRISGLISGFVMPHSGRMKKIICEGITYINLDKMINELINSLNEDQINKLKKHFGKEDFKKDLLEKIDNNIKFSAYKKIEGKSFFKIVKFPKNFFEKGVPFEGFLIDRFLSVSYSVLIEKFKWIEVELTRVKKIKAIMKILNNENHDNIPLREGDTLI